MTDPQRLLLDGDRRQGKYIELTLLRQITREVILVQTLHDDDDGARLFIIQPAVQRLVMPVVNAPALRLRLGVSRFDRVVDDQHAATPTCESSAHRCCKAKAMAGGCDLSLGILASAEAGCGKGSPVPVGFDHNPAIARVLAGQLVGIADRDDTARRIMTEKPSGQRDRCGDRFQRPRRQVDDQPDALS